MNTEVDDAATTPPTIPILSLARQRALVDERLERRARSIDASLIVQVQAIFEQVRRTGDRAVLDATREHDGVTLGSLRIPVQEAERAVVEVPAELRAAIDVARSRIARVNEQLLTRDRIVDMEPGVRIGELFRPLDAVALWIPCRKGPLLSTALMLVCAARAAGVRRIVAMMPPRVGGSADPGTLATCRLAGATEYAIGNGVALIAAATHGTASLPRVDGVFGPGPDGIAVAMGMAGMFGLKTVVGIGPTDCAVLADDSADPRLVAWDLASEAEHGPDSASLLVTNSESLAQEVAAHLREIISSSVEPRRTILSRVFGSDGRGMLVVCPDFTAACLLAAQFAPEHLSIVCDAERREHTVRGCQLRDRHHGRVADERSGACRVWNHCARHAAHHDLRRARAERARATRPDDRSAGSLRRLALSRRRCKSALFPGCRALMRDVCRTPTAERGGKVFAGPFRRCFVFAGAAILAAGPPAH